MKYKKLAEVYSKLEGTTKKLEKRDILADFFKETEPDVLEIVATLAMGRIFPAWKEKEMGIAENLMIKTISKTAGVPEKKIKKELKKEGDLGVAAENILKKKKQKTLSKRELSIKDVHEKLEKIPEVSGSGSIDEKTSILAELLSSASSEEGKYIVRTVLEEMRVGVGEGIVRNAVSKAFDIDKDIVEHAYNVRNDFGEVAKIAKEKGKKGLEKLKLEIGRPIKPMLAQKAESAEQVLKDMGGKAAFEIKYDGMRIQIHKKGNEIIVFTRRLDNVTKQFPDIVKYAEKGIKAKNCIIEGEAVGINPKTKNPLPFQKLSRRIKRKYDIKEIKKKIPVEVNLFDVMFLEGKTLVEKPFKARRKELEKIIDEIKGKFQLAVNRVYSEKKKVEDMMEDSLRQGHEGLMAKNLEKPYTPGSRVKHMYKLKPVKESLDLIIIGALWGEGRRSEWLGSYLLGAKDPDTDEFVEIGKVATGLTDSDLEELTDKIKPLITSEKGKKIKAKPKIVVEVGYGEIQKSPKYESGFALRFPKVLNIREDKSPSDVDSMDKVERLYKAQKEK